MSSNPPKGITVKLELPPKLIPVFSSNAFVKAAYGGRGSGKFRNFAKMAAVKGYQHAEANEPGVMVCGREFQNSLADSSFAEVKLAIQSEPWLDDVYDCGDNYIRTKDKKIEFAFCGLRHNLSSIKSKSRIRLLYIDEAEPVSELAWNIVIPTIREEGSEIWLTWNPERKNSATNKRFIEDPPEDAYIVKLNWRDNPWFTSVLNNTRLEDKRKRPDQYEHIWEGEYVTVYAGAYFAKPLTEAREQRRIGKLNADPLMSIRAFFDIGGTGAKADAVAIWVAQFIGKEIRALDHYEAVGQPLSVHVAWLRDNGYTPDKHTRIYLPHDGVTNDKVYDVSYESELRRAGYMVEVVPNQGAGAAMQRVEAMRRAFPFIWFDEARCAGGLEALGAYHEKIDEVRGIGLGPEHNWASHSCLIAGTLIKTSRGLIPIEQVNIGDRVDTPADYAYVDKSGMSKISTELLEITLSDGKTITVTPEHKIFTTKGVVNADTLGYNDSILTIENKSWIQLANAKYVGYRSAFIESTKGINIGSGRNVISTFLRKVESIGVYIEKYSAMEKAKSILSMVTGMILRNRIGQQDEKIPAGIIHSNMTIKSLMALNITGNQIAVIMQEDTLQLSIYIGQFGHFITDQFLTNSIFIIKTKINQIIQSVILNLFQQANIQVRIPKIVNGLEAKKINSNLLKLKNLQKNGIPAKKEKNGIEKMALKHLRKNNNLMRFVRFVERNIKLTSQKDQCIVARIVKIRRYIKSVPVYDLTVRKHHCYFANGILVSNSDAAGMMAVVYERDTRDQARPQEEPRRKSDWRL